MLAREVSGISRWHTLIGGIEFGNTGIAIAGGVWQHVADVRYIGTLRFYLNGTQVSSTFANTPNVPTGNLLFGNLDGQKDEVRVFTFNPGEFDPATDLLFSAANLTALLPVPPAPEATSAALLGCAMSLFARRRRAQ